MNKCNYITVDKTKKHMQGNENVNTNANEKSKQT